MIRILQNHVLAPCTSLRIGGPCRGFAEPSNAEELLETRLAAQSREWSAWFLGGGSNVLISDAGYPGLVVRYGDRSIAIEAIGLNDALVRAGARAPLAGIARMTARAGWAGLEWAEGIPGTVAGAAVGNAGAYGGDMASVVESVTVLNWAGDGATSTWPAARLAYTYRGSSFKRGEAAGHVVLTVTMRVRREDPSRLESELRRIGEERRFKTPSGATCGSVFRNPPGDHAGRLIDASGCKGMRFGRAVVSSQHANYIINEGDASAAEMLALIRQVRQRVREMFRVDLAPEIQFVGFREDEIEDLTSA